MPGLVKIGATRKHPIRRATELSAGTGVPGDFIVVYWLAFHDCFEAERLIHKRFENERIDEAREFFRISPDEVVSAIEELTLTLTSDGRQGGEWIDNGGCAARDTRWGPSVQTPLAELFASFPDDGSPRELTPDEARQCQEALARNR